MGAQQAKSEEEAENFQIGQQDYKQWRNLSEDVTTHTIQVESMNENRTETVMTEQNSQLVSPTKLIKVANFAKIKIEPRVNNECIENQHITDGNTGNIQEQNTNLRGIPINSQELTSLNNNTVPEQQNSIACKKVNLISHSSANNSENISKLQIKQELLDSHSDHVKQSDVTLQNLEEEPIVELGVIKTEPLDDPLNNDNANKEFKNPLAAKIKIETVNIENSFEVPVHLIKNTTQHCNINQEIIEIDEGSVEDDIKEKDRTYLQLVKNPLAFSRNLSNNKKSRKHLEFYKKSNQDRLNKSVETELTKNGAKEEDKHLKNTTDIQIIDLEAEQPMINLKELIIKSEALCNLNHQNQLNLYNKSNFNKNCLSYNSSLDVNLSNCDNDEVLSAQNFAENVSNISVNTSSESLKHYSINELSSEENVDMLVKKAENSIDNKSRKKLKLQKHNVRRSCRNEEKRSLSYSNQCKTKSSNRGRKPKFGNKKPRKYSEKDYSFHTGFLTRKAVKNLPKTAIKTRRKLNKANTPKKSTNSSSRTDFPKPFKPESSTILQKDHNIAIQLPKPMMFKLELHAINVKDKQHYLKPKFQPYVRLKRLKSEELLVPLKTKGKRRIKTAMSRDNVDKRLNVQRTSNENKRDFLIQHAFSLNQRMQLNRLSIDHDNSCFNNDQPSLCSHLTTPYSMPTNDTTNESLAETDSKYFRPQEPYSLFQHTSTPDVSSSIFSSNIDSGVSTAAHDYNKTLLLEIAAERAFINNHLEHFGYSKI